MSILEEEPYSTAKSLLEIGPFIWKVVKSVGDKLKQKYSPKVKSPKEVPFHYKLLFVGGGEIALELALVGVDCFWEPKCIDETNETLPMQKIGDIADIASFDTGFCKEIDYLSLSAEEAPRDTLSEVEDFILKEKPDTVLLEKNFIPIENWKVFCRETDYQLRYKKVHFLPNSENVDFFLDKIEMKRKLKTMLGEDHINYLPAYDKIKIDKDKEEIIKKIKIFLESHKIAILKPPITESGYGQSEINSKSSKRDIEIAIDRLRAASVKHQKSALLEEKKEIISEIYYAAFRPVSNLNCDPKIMGPIEYQKQSCGFGGPVRLIKSRYPPENLTRVAQKVMEELLIKICKAIKVPFLAVEYFLCDNEKVYINEITWRPDDAGFITMLSHERSQFKLFIDSLEKSELAESRVNDGKFVCLTIMREEELVFYPSLPSIKGEGWIVNFYQKGFPTTFRRIVGYAIVDLKGSSFSTIDDFKEYLRENVLARQFGREEAEKFYF
jgi:formate-dependent phosphoribosylglycinamide formyltransferase (GAR transformylase)